MNTIIEKNKEIDKIVVPLKQLSNVWRTLEISLINCEINLILTWSENCVLIVLAPGYSPARPEINAPTVATFMGVLGGGAVAPPDCWANMASQAIFV